MNHSISYKVIATALSLLVLMSTLSLTVEKHFCGDRLVDVAIFTETKTCCAHKTQQEDKEKKSCCKDEVEIIAGNDELATTSFEDFDMLQKHVIVAYAFSYLNLYQSLPKKIIPHRDYSPPLLVCDIHILDETFLI
ncbi:MAG: hypothetical protein Wins2KO_13710 [Winogradskyella sp.]